MVCIVAFSALSSEINMKNEDMWKHRKKMGENDENAAQVNIHVLNVNQQLKMIQQKHS